MKISRTVVFLLLLAAAAAAYIYQNRLSLESYGIIPDEIARQVELGTKKWVKSVNVINYEKNINFTVIKTEQNWEMGKPVFSFLESGAAEAMAAAVQMASKQPRLRAEKDWDEYGLKDPRMEINVILSDGKTETLLLGANVPIGKAFYAKWKRERGYFLWQPEMKTVFDKTIYSIRAKRAIRAPAKEWTKIYIEMGAYSVQWKKEGESWYWFEPIARFGDKTSESQIRAVTSAIQGLNKKEFLDDNKKSNADMGFFLIHDRVMVTLENGEQKTIQFGDEIADKDSYYGMVEGEQGVFLIDRKQVIKLFEIVRGAYPPGEAK